MTRTPENSGPKHTAEKAARRKLMLERAKLQGLEHFSDLELLELLLRIAREPGDPAQLAQELLDAFGTLKCVMDATPNQLMRATRLSERSITLVSLMAPLSRRYELSVIGQSRLKSSLDLQRYCNVLLRDKKCSCFYMLGLRNGYNLAGQRLIASGSLRNVRLDPRSIAQAALLLKTQRLVFCHNHPTGSCTPSDVEKLIARFYRKQLRELDLELVDHIIVSDFECYSMADHGDLF